VHCAGGRKAVDCTPAMPCSREPAHTRAPSHECLHSRTHRMRTRTHGCRDAGTQARCQHACARKRTADREAEGGRTSHVLARAASGFGSCSTTACTAAMVGFAVTVPVGLVGAAVRWLLHVECSPLERRTLRRASYVACWLPRVAHSSSTVYARRRTQTNTRHRRAPALSHLRACRGLRSQCGAGAH
jgi:hypothetical protein